MRHHRPPANVELTAVYAATSTHNRNMLLTGPIDGIRAGPQRDLWQTRTLATTTRIPSTRPPSHPSRSLLHQHSSLTPQSINTRSRNARRAVGGVIRWPGAGELDCASDHRAHCRRRPRASNCRGEVSMLERSSGDAGRSGRASQDGARSLDREAQAALAPVGVAGPVERKELAAGVPEPEKQESAAAAPGARTRADRDLGCSIASPDRVRPITIPTGLACMTMSVPLPVEAFACLPKRNWVGCFLFLGSKRESRDLNAGLAQVV
jgi:hypothetical protein